MTDFWENKFVEKQTMWGFEPAESAIRVKDFFMKEKVNEILIPGIGYGRNVKIFLENSGGIEPPLCKAATHLPSVGKNSVNIKQLQIN